MLFQSAEDTEFGRPCHSVGFAKVPIPSNGKLVGSLFKDEERNESVH